MEKTNVGNVKIFPIFFYSNVNAVGFVIRSISFLKSLALLLLKEIDGVLEFESSCQL